MNMKNNEAEPHIKPRDAHVTGADNDAPDSWQSELFKPPASAAERREVLKLAQDASGAAKPTGELDFTADHLKRVVENSIGLTNLGTKVPDDAAILPGFEVDKRVKCATTSSEWLVEMGLMSNEEFQLRVNDFVELLPGKGFHEQVLHGKLDPKQFPEGPIGFIVGQGMARDGSNHIAYAERRGDTIRIVHNDWATGKVVDQKVQDVFYDKDGQPRYDDLTLFVLPRQQTNYARRG